MDETLVEREVPAGCVTANAASSTCAERLQAENQTEKRENDVETEEQDGGVEGCERRARGSRALATRMEWTKNFPAAQHARLLRHIPKSVQRESNKRYIMC